MENRTIRTNIFFFPRCVSKKQGFSRTQRLVPSSNPYPMASNRTKQESVPSFLRLPVPSLQGALFMHDVCEVSGFIY